MQARQRGRLARRRAEEHRRAAARDGGDGGDDAAGGVRMGGEYGGAEADEEVDVPYRLPLQVGGGGDDGADAMLWALAERWGLGDAGDGGGGDAGGGRSGGKSGAPAPASASGASGRVVAAAAARDGPPAPPSAARRGGELAFPARRLAAADPASRSARCERGLLPRRRRAVRRR